MTIPTNVTNHQDWLNDRVKAQFREQTNWLKLFAVYGPQFQEVEDALYQLLTERYLDKAIGTQLDVLGEIVDVERAGLSDGVYRTRIRFKIGQNTSGGTLDDLIRIFKILTLADLVYINEYQYAKIALGFGSNISDAIKTLINTYAQKMVAAGVKVVEVYSFDPDESFAYYGEPDEGAKGYDDGTGLIGGKYAGTI